MKTISVLTLLSLCFNVTFAIDTLTIIHVNDTHSNLAPGGRRNADLSGTVGGIARAATYIGTVRQQFPDALLLHAGDIYIGDLFFQRYFGVAELQLMSALGFKAMAVGNHEFDLTPQVLETALSTAFSNDPGFPLLSANINLDDSTVKGLRRYIQPSVIETVGNIKVGIFGMTTPETNTLSQPSPVWFEEKFNQLIEIAQGQVDSLRAEGCHVVVMLSHLGQSLDEGIAQVVRGIDLIVGGHDHYVLKQAKVVGTTPIVQAGAFYHEIGIVQLTVNQGSVALVSSQVDVLDESIPEDPTVAAIVGQLVAEIEQTYGQVYSQRVAEADHDCAEVAEDLLSNGSKDTPLGNIITDAYRIFGGTDISIQPGGSIAQMIYKGPLVAADAFRTVGYGFNTFNGLGYRMVSYSLTGEEILIGLEFGLGSLEGNDEFLLQCSGMNYTYNPDSKIQKVTSVKIGGQQLDPTKRYTITTNEFVFEFLNFIGVSPADPIFHGDTTEYVVLLDYISAVKKLNPTVEGRIRAEHHTSVVEPEHSRGSLMMWPCPTAGEVTVSTANSNDIITEVAIYTSATQQVFPTYTIYDNQTCVNTRELSNGLYIVKVSTVRGTQSGLFVVDN